MIAAEIANALGNAHRSGSWWRSRCPVHGSRGATLALRDGDRALIAVCHAGCSRADILAELRQRGLFGRGSGDSPAPSLRVACDDDARRMTLARRIWGRAQNARETPVVAYLADRGITTSLPLSLRWAPALRRTDGTNGPAMVARIDSIDDELIGISRTWLSRDNRGIWQRRDRAMIGRAGGGAVQLARAAETLMVGEGIETCMAAMQATSMPVWAALSTSGLVSLVLPAIAQEIIILADHDTNGAGERAANTAAERWLAEGRRVRIAMPPEPGIDFANVLLRRAHGWIAEVRDVAA